MLAIRRTRLPQHGAPQIALRAHTQHTHHIITILTRTSRTSSSSIVPFLRQRRAISPPAHSHTRWLSTNKRRPNYYEPPPPNLSFWQFVKHIFRPFNIFQMTRTDWHNVIKENPLAFTVAGICYFGIFCCTIWTILYFREMFGSDEFLAYPEDVAISMRRAIAYSTFQNDPAKAIKYYQQATDQCFKHNMDSFSDPVVGIKVRVSQWLESKLKNVPEAAAVLDVVLQEHKEWLRICAESPEKLPWAPAPGRKIGEGESERTITRDEFETWLWPARNRTMKNAVKISIKLGDLCAHDQMLQTEKSHKHLVWAVETSLKEFRRRAAEGVKEGEGDWFSSDEVGATLESLAHSYERKNQFDIALPLFFRALAICQDQCHMAVLMNNLAVAFAQHPPRAPYETLEGIVNGETSAESLSHFDQHWTRRDLLESGQRWAKNALQHAKEPTGDKRTPECDQACAVALVNLGDIAILLGDFREAQARFERAISVSEKNNFPEGAQQARAGLEKLAQ